MTDAIILVLLFCIVPVFCLGVYNRDTQEHLVNELNKLTEKYNKVYENNRILKSELNNFKLQYYKDISYIAGEIPSIKKLT